jgi:hypothetical protein
VPADALVLHLVARNLTRKGDDFVPVKSQLGENRSGSWGAYPAENWIVLDRGEWQQLLPQGPATVGTTWDVNPGAAGKLLMHFYPATENNDARKNRIDQLVLRGKVLSVGEGVVRTRLDGALKMKHPFYHRDDDKFVEADVVGLMEFEPGTKKVLSLQLATTRATYGSLPFGVVVCSLP